MRENPYASSWTEPPHPGEPLRGDEPAPLGNSRRIAWLLAPPIITGTGLSLAILLMWIGWIHGLFLALFTALLAIILIFNASYRVAETLAGRILVFFGESVATLTVWAVIVERYLPDK